MGILIVYDVTDEKSFSSELHLERDILCASVKSSLLTSDIRTWHSQIDQHASAGVNKILIGNKCDWDEKRVVTVEQGRELADEFGLRFLETSAKANEGVEEAFFTLARWVSRVMVY